MAAAREGWRSSATVAAAAAAAGGRRPVARQVRAVLVAVWEVALVRTARRPEAAAVAVAVDRAPVAGRERMWGHLPLRHPQARSVRAVAGAAVQDSLRLRAAAAVAAASTAAAVVARRRIRAAAGAAGGRRSPRRAQPASRTSRAYRAAPAVS